MAVLMRCAALCVWLALAGMARASGEYELKAAYLLNFARYTEWPAAAFADASSPLVIGVAGTDPFGGELERVTHDKLVAKRRVAVERSDLKKAHLVYVPRDAHVELRGPVLVVGEAPDFARHGGLIELFVDQGRIRFRVNNTAAKAAGLSFSSKLLSLASDVF